MTLPNQVLGFILSGNFKPLFLCEFFTDWPENWMVYSRVCILVACNNSLSYICLLQFHVFGSLRQWEEFSTLGQKSPIRCRDPPPPLYKEYSHEIFVRTYCFRMWIFQNNSLLTLAHCWAGYGNLLLWFLYILRYRYCVSFMSKCRRWRSLVSAFNIFQWRGNIIAYWGPFNHRCGNICNLFMAFLVAEEGKIWQIFGNMHGINNVCNHC